MTTKKAKRRVAGGTTVEASLARAYRVPPGKRKLFVVEAAVEVRSKAELDQICEAIGRIMCPVPACQEPGLFTLSFNRRAAHE